MSKWPEESKAVERAVRSQIHFDFTAETLQALKIEAARKNISASDMIRSILGLDTISRPLRPRVGVSFSQEERLALAELLETKQSQDANFKQRCQDKINQHFAAKPR